MTTLQELHRKTSSTVEYNKLQRFVRPMCEYFNISQFYYCKVQGYGKQGFFSSVETNLDWREYVFNNTALMKSSPALRHPDTRKSELVLFNASDCDACKTLDIAWNKFNIHFAVNIQRKSLNAVESFGLGLNTKHRKAEQHILNHLPLLNKFIDCFFIENSNLIRIAEENQVEISSIIGTDFYKEIPDLSDETSKKNLLKQLGLNSLNLLTKREIDMLKYLAYGYPASYIAIKTHLSKRTVENYIASIKCKLGCDSKVSLINKSKDLCLEGFFDS